ncbi:hypothetical protein GCM10022416_16580 [Actinomadura keratinilytica]|uniref:DUF397 domain-containing protein n=1 Tax=Actinomadura keratinilytica TaxID=547461 RepID=A0ABP7YE78_9ACTN
MVLIRALASWRESRRVCRTTMGTSLVTTRQWSVPTGIGSGFFRSFADGRPTADVLGMISG